MFESNFPVNQASCGYTTPRSAFKRITAGWPVQERAALFHNNAMLFCRLSGAA